MGREFLAGGLVGVFLVGVLVASFVLPLNVGPMDGPFEHGDSEQFVSLGFIAADGDLLVRHEATVLAADDAHLELEYAEGTVESVYDDGKVYTKYEAHSDEEEWIESRRPSDGDVVHSGEHGDRLILITEEDGTFDSEELRFIRTSTIRCDIFTSGFCRTPNDGVRR